MFEVDDFYAENNYVHVGFFETKAEAVEAARNYEWNHEDANIVIYDAAKGDWIEREDWDD